MSYQLYILVRIYSVNSDPIRKMCFLLFVGKTSSMKDQNLLKAVKQNQNSP